MLIWRITVEQFNLKRLKTKLQSKQIFMANIIVSWGLFEGIADYMVFKL